MGFENMSTANRPEGSRSIRLPALSAPHSPSEVHLPSHVERLLLDVVADGFIVRCCGPKAAPFALVASYQWKDHVDLVTIRRLDWITTARACAPPHSSIDVFAPEVVVWTYEGPPQWALRALLELVHPQHPNAPLRAYPAPPSLNIPPAEQRPMTIRFPPPDRAGTRAARLAVAVAPAPANGSSTTIHSNRSVIPRQSNRSVVTAMTTNDRERARAWAER